MKKQMIYAAVGAGLMLTGCGEKEPEISELTVNAEEGFDDEYAELVKGYFQAIDDADYEAYRAALYPPFADAFANYLETQDSSLEEVFDDICHRFDEDGYESWTLTELDLSWYPEEKLDVDGFFAAYLSAGYFDEKFVEDTKADITEIRDVQFSLWALYEGDEEAAQVVSGKEIMVVKNADGVYLFG